MSTSFSYRTKRRISPPHTALHDIAPTSLSAIKLVFDLFSEIERLRFPVFQPRVLSFFQDMAFPLPTHFPEIDISTRI
jgi:hypothetical protein